MTSREDLIEEARKAVLTMDYERAYQGGLVGRLADALESEAVFEQAPSTPTDDEPVAYGIYGRVTGNLKYVQVMDEHEVEEQSEFYDVVPLFRRTAQGETPKVMDSDPITSKTAQGEPTDAEVEAAAEAIASTIYGDPVRAALRAAAAVREEGQGR